jgi:hypothetical protein
MANLYDIGDDVRCGIEILDYDTGTYVDPATLIFTISDPDGLLTIYTYGTDPQPVRISTGIYFTMITATKSGQWHYSYRSTVPNIATDGSFEVGETLSYGVELTETSDLDYLLPELRLHLWDINEPHTYTDSFLRRTLLVGVKLLMPRWNSRYIPSYNSVTVHWDISRNSQDVFIHAAPPTIQYGDERPIILAASIALKSGLIYMAGTNAVSWRDDEVSFSNLTGAQLQEASLLREIDELNKLVPERRQRLARAIKGELIGFRNPPNTWEG